MKPEDFEIKAFAPASIGNLTVGFDVLGMALPFPGDTVYARKNDSKALRIVGISGDDGKLPQDVDKNTASFAVQLLQKKIDSSQGIDLFIEKGISLGSGMGSSAASAVAAVVAVNELLGNPLTKEELAPFTIQAEGLASGNAHGDNVLPSLLGGIVLIHSNDPIRIKELPVPEELYCGILDPDLQIFTKEAREILPKEIQQKEVIRQVADMGAFVSSLYSADLDLMKACLRDVLAEPYRQKLIPHYDEVITAAKAHDIIHIGISGSGPAIFTLAADEKENTKALEAAVAAFAEKGIKSQFHQGSAKTDGAYALKI